MGELRGKVAVVTGAGAGIGRATSLALAREGTAGAVCDLDVGAAKETANLIEAAGGRASRLLPAAHGRLLAQPVELLFRKALGQKA